MFKLDKINFNKIYMIASLLIFFLFGILISFNSKDLSYIFKIKLIPILFISFLLWLLHPVIRLKSNGIIRKAILVLSIVTFISGLIKFDFIMMLSSITLFITYDFLLKALINSDKLLYYNIISKSLILSGLISLTIFGISPYNSQGIIYSFIGIMTLNYLCINKIKIIPFYAIVVLTFISIIFVTKSRTGMLAFLTVSVITMGYYFINSKVAKKIIIISIFLGLILIYNDDIGRFFYSIFFEKWGNTDLTSNRLYIWKYIVDNKAIFGNGFDFIDAHNSFFQILASEGVLCFLLFIIFILILFYKLIKLQSEIYYFNFFIGWIVVSCFENLDLLSTRMIPVTFLFLVHLAFFDIEQSIKEQIL